ncbi:hypothetical protein [Mesoplasma tabanidae]|uniref:Uncharacterized protein n=1 Tax=Mesoplasma tabanidae TaxID=219745 RepID=A0A2K8P3I9_9MOLU|nr:hypothetical protein [Mesoplasma tabanidae]ATZ21256.1 hypothetical protein MTABA_v1c00500 [Mesoplasma tabanidae]
MKNKEFEIIDKLGGKQVNIYLNDETLILEKIFEQKYKQKPNRSKIYKDFLKKQLNQELINEIKDFDKNICSCCKNDYSFTKKQMYICSNKENINACIICDDCIPKK